jgi:hypothetical protein
MAKCETQAGHRPPCFDFAVAQGLGPVGGTARTAAVSATGVAWGCPAAAGMPAGGTQPFRWRPLVCQGWPAYSIQVRQIRAGTAAAGHPWIAKRCAGVLAACSCTPAEAAAGLRGVSAAASGGIAAIGTCLCHCGGWQHCQCTPRVQPWRWEKWPRRWLAAFGAGALATRPQWLLA